MLNEQATQYTPNFENMSPIPIPYIAYDWQKRNAKCSWEFCQGSRINEIDANKFLSQKWGLVVKIT